MFNKDLAETGTQFLKDQQQRGIAGELWCSNDIARPCEQK